MEKRFFNVKEIATYLGLSEDTIRAWVKTGKIPFSKLGRSVRFDLRRIDQWLKKKEYPYIRKTFGELK
jgi:excisionase family DNA binding protein